MARPQKKLKVIASRAGCSIPTVWRALRGKPVSATNRDKIIQAMHGLNYGEYVRYKVGLILPETYNPFFSELAFSFEAAMEKRDAQVLITSAETSLEREVKLLRRFLAMDVDGLVYVPTAHGSQALLTLIAEGEMPVVVFDRKVTNGNFDFVTVESEVGTYRAIEHLMKFGHKSIGYLRGLDNTFPAQDRLDSFIAAMTRNKLAVNHNWIFRGDFSLKSGISAAQQLLKMRRHDRPTAMLTANDWSAIGLMHRLQQARWSIPGDLSIIGFDNIQWSRWTNPPLTTIAQPLDDMVNQASNALLARIDAFKGNRRALEVNAYSMAAALIVRSSVARHSRS